MKSSLIATLFIVLLATAIQPVNAMDDSDAFTGLTSINAIYDVRSADEKKLQFILKVIRDTYDETVAQDVKSSYIASMRGPTVKLLVRGRAGDKELKQETVKLIGDLQLRGIRLEACGYALNLFGIEPEDLYEGVVTVGNSLNSLIGYQAKGYALVPMN